MVNDISNNFINAIKRQDIVLAEELLSKGANINSIDKQGRTALLIATEQKNLKMVQWLLTKGADINYYNPESNTIEKTAFLYAGANGLNEILDILIEYNPDVSILNRYGGTALIPACERGHIETVKKLLNKTKININHVNNLGWTALLEAIILSDGGAKHQKIIRILLDNGANPSIPDKDGITPLQHAEKKGYSEIVDMIKRSMN